MNAIQGACQAPAWKLERDRRSALRNAAAGNYQGKRLQPGQIQFNTHHAHYEYADCHGRVHVLARDLVEANDACRSRRMEIERDARDAAKRLVEAPAPMPSACIDIGRRAQ
jgi:hypothetical protein